MTPTQEECNRTSQTVLTYSTEESFSWETESHFMAKKYPTFMEHECYYYVKKNQLNPIHNFPSHLSSILKLSSHLHRNITSSLFLAGFPAKILYVFLIFHMYATSSAHHTLLKLIILIIFNDYYQLQICHFAVSPSSCYFLSQVQIFSQQCVLKILKSVFSLLPCHKKQQAKLYLYFCILIFRFFDRR